MRADLTKFRDSLANNAPKTRITSLTAVLRFLEDNEIVFPKTFLSNLRGKQSEAISEEYIPTNADLAKFIEYLPLLGRAIVLTLSSSGMRIGECLKLKIEDVDFGKTPPYVSIKASTTKTKHKRLVFISGEARSLIEEWLQYRNEWLMVQQVRSIFHINARATFTIPFL